MLSFRKELIEDILIILGCRLFVVGFIGFLAAIEDLEDFLLHFMNVNFLFALVLDFREIFLFRHLFNYPIFII